MRNEIENENEYAVKNEKMLLKKIDNLPDILINKIYDFMSGKPKFICNKKYDILTNIIKDDCYRGYKFWHLLTAVFEPMTSKQLYTFVQCKSNNFKDFVVNRIWYFSRETGKFYENYNLFELWYEGNNQQEDNKSIDTMVRCRIKDAIYHYFILKIKFYEKNYNFCLNINFDDNKNKTCINSNCFLVLDKIFYLYKSIEYLYLKKKFI